MFASSYFFPFLLFFFPYCDWLEQEYHKTLRYGALPDPAPAANSATNERPPVSEFNDFGDEEEVREMVRMQDEFEEAERLKRENLLLKKLTEEADKVSRAADEEEEMEFEVFNLDEALKSANLGEKKKEQDEEKKKTLSTEKEQDIDEDSDI